MPTYTLAPMTLSYHGEADSLRVAAAFISGATADQRQKAIDILISTHKMDISTTKSIIYDPKMKSPPGDNKLGAIRIGVEAFEQDLHWLAVVIFHETVHSHQFKFYDVNGITMSKMKATDEPVRMWRALDELEAQYWALANATALMLSGAQVKELKRLVRWNRIELGDSHDTEIKPLVDKAKFDDARLILINRQKAGAKP